MISKCLIYTFFIFPNFIKNELKSVKKAIICEEFVTAYMTEKVKYLFKTLLNN